MVQLVHEGSVCVADGQAGPAAACLPTQNSHQDCQGKKTEYGVNTFLLGFLLMLIDHDKSVKFSLAAQGIPLSVNERLVYECCFGKTLTRALQQKSRCKTNVENCPSRCCF